MIKPSERGEKSSAEQEFATGRSAAPSFRLRDPGHSFKALGSGITASVPSIHWG